MRNLRRCMSDRSDPGSVIPVYRFIHFINCSKEGDPLFPADLLLYFLYFLYYRAFFRNAPCFCQAIPGAPHIRPQITLSLCSAKLSTITFICSRKNSSIPVV